MGYVSRKGRRPNEYASKSSHSHIINDASVQKFLATCNLPKTSQEIKLPQAIDFKESKNNPIQHIIAIDGGYSEVAVKKEFPSSVITFFQFGALIFSKSDLEKLSAKPFIDPDDMMKLKEIQRYKLTLPTKNITLSNEDSLIDSVRKTILGFFLNEPQDGKFIETIRWLLFEEYNNNGISQWNLANCPTCGIANVKLDKASMQNGYLFKCPKCSGKIYLTDIFRLHEAIDNELGAGGILGYLTNLLEQIVLIHLIRLILNTKPSLLGQILFIKDGPLAFFGQTANMYQPMRKLILFLLKNHNLFLAGLEKSGAFVEHADEISRNLKSGSILLLSNKYIYKYIIPGKADPNNPYGKTTYYSGKLIFKSDDERIYVLTIPTKEALLNPSKSDFPNLDVILTNIKKLKCDMYDSSLIPISLVNKLVSLADHPSSVILEKFARDRVNR